MKIAKLMLIALILASLLISGCSKEKKATDENEQAMSTAEGETAIPTITNEKIDEFLKSYPVVMDKMLARMDELAGLEDDNPASNAKANQIFEEIQNELQTMGINLNEINVLYQKIQYAVSHIAQKKKMESVPPEQIDEQIAEFNKLMTDPSTTDEMKSQIQNAITELENAKSKKFTVPAGLTDAEVAAVEARYDQIEASLMQQIEKVRQAQMKLEG